MMKEEKPDTTVEVHLQRDPRAFFAALRSHRHHVVSTIPLPANLKAEVGERYLRDGIERARTLRGLHREADQRAGERASCALDYAEEIGITTGLAGPRIT